MGREDLRAKAAASLPQIALSSADFAHALEAHLCTRPERDETPIDAEELMIAAACARQNKAALELFEARYIGPLSRTLARFRFSAFELDEVRQQVRERLLLLPEGETRTHLERAAGYGSLLGLVKVTASRIALNKVRDREQHEANDDQALIDAIAEGTDIENALGKAKHRDAFISSLSKALTALDPEERELLRAHHLEGITLPELALRLDISRATLVRRLAAVREKVLLRTSDALRVALGEDSSAASVYALIQSRLDVSLGALVR